MNASIHDVRQLKCSTGWGGEGLALIFKVLGVGFLKQYSSLAAYGCT